MNLISRFQVMGAQPAPHQPDDLTEDAFSSEKSSERDLLEASEEDGVVWRTGLATDRDGAVHIEEAVSSGKDDLSPSRDRTEVGEAGKVADMDEADRMSSSIRPSTSEASTLNPQPSTLNHQPSTLNP